MRSSTEEERKGEREYRGRGKEEANTEIGKKDKGKDRGREKRGIRREGRKEVDEGQLKERRGQGHTYLLTPDFSFLRFLLFLCLL